MPGLEWVDFSGGMVSDINEVVAGDNTFKTMQNVDCWSELGTAKPLTGLVFLDNFPTDKVYHHHVVFPAHGVKDYAIIMMTDGTIYSYDPTAGTEFVSIGSVTAGARMAYANDRVYVFYRNMTAPTTGNTVRKAIEYDYSAGTFSISDILIKEYFTVGETAEISHANAGESYYAKMIYNDVRNDNSESKGVVVFAQDDNEAQFSVKITKVAGFYGLRCYGSIKDDIGSTFLTPGLLFEIKDEPSYIPITDGFITGGGDGFSDTDEIVIIKTDAGGVNNASFLSFILDEWDSGNLYITTNHKIKAFGVEYNIDSITKDTTTSPPAVFYILGLDANVPAFTMYPTETLMETQGGNYVDLEIQLDFYSDIIYLPIMRRFREIAGIPIDENRPESSFTSGTGNFLAPLGNYLFTANPYFPDLFATGDDLDKKGWLSWSWITGEGLYAFGLLPDVQLITSPSFSSEIIDTFNFRENMLVFHKGGLVRFVLENGIPVPFDSDEHGIDDDFNYYKDKFRLFLYSNKKIKMAVFTRKNIEKGEFDFVEISRGIGSLVYGTVDARFGYLPKEKLLFFNDLNGNVSNYICSLRNQKPVWILYSDTAGVAGEEATIYDSFTLNGKTYFVGTDTGVYRTYEEQTSLLPNVIIESHNKYFPLGNDYIRKVEILYQQASGQFTFEIYADDTQIYTEVIGTVKSTPSFYEIKLPRTSTTRYDKVRWKITYASPGESNFKLLGVFVNRDDYGRETTKGY